MTRKVNRKLTDAQVIALRENATRRAAAKAAIRDARAVLAALPTQSQLAQSMGICHQQTTAIIRGHVYKELRV